MELRVFGMAAIAVAFAAWSAPVARADGLTFSADPPAGVSVVLTAANGATTTVDRDTGFDTFFKSDAAWTVSSLQLELTISQRTDTAQVIPVCLATGAFVFSVDAPRTYTLSGQYSYFPYVAGSGAVGYGYAIVNLRDVTDDVYLFRNTLDGAASSGTSFTLGENTGDPIGYVAGSLIGTLLPGHLYTFDFWVQTVNYTGGPAVGAEAVFRLDAAPLTTTEFATWANDIASTVAATPLSSVLAPNALSAAGGRASLVERIEDAADAITAGDFAAARALLTSVRDRIDGVKKPENRIAASADQTALLEELDALLSLLD